MQSFAVLDPYRTETDKVWPAVGEMKSRSAAGTRRSLDVQFTIIYSHNVRGSAPSADHLYSMAHILILDDFQPNITGKCERG
jgi:hypothetical protein